MAKVAIDARMWNESGVGRYIRNLVGNLQKLDSKNEYFLILLEKEFKSLEFNQKSRLPRRFAPRNDKEGNFHKVLGGFRWYGVEEQIRLPRILKRINADVVHFPHFNVPIFYKGKFVVTIHDLIHQHFQMRRATTRDPFTYRLKHFGYITVFKNAVKKSEKILVPSNFVKKLLVNEWMVDQSKVVVTNEAVDQKIIAIAKKLSTNRAEKALNKFGIKIPYIFYVGNAHPHKNVEGLIKAFLQLKENYKDLQLVLSGSDHYFWQKIKMDSRWSLPRTPIRGGNYNKVKDIVYTGYVADEELVALYKNARCFVMPSFEEGFGIPTLEAMASGCPVVSSNAASLPEIAGDAAIYFDPNNLDDMVNKIMHVLSNVRLRKKLIEKGKKRFKQFSWEKLAKQTLQVYIDPPLADDKGSK